ncbi:MAG: endonuclease/exonuclease/phosphatase family protein [Candidatus Saccharimonadales bacterium]
MNEILTVASANTQMGRLLTYPGRLAALAQCDILLLQEVRLDDNQLERSLSHETDLRIANYDHDLALAIAVDKHLTVSATSDFLLQDEAMLTRILTNYRLMQTAKFRLRGRGLISAGLRTPAGNKLTVGTVHPTIPLKFSARNKQVSDIPIYLGPDNHQPLIMAGDMNHWPGPHAADLEMMRKTALKPVDFGEQSTFDISQTRYAWLGRLGIKIDGQLDAMYYRGPIQPFMANLRPVASDHKALGAGFEFTHG